MNYDIKAVIFDLDATLLDTEPNWFLSDRKLLHEYGVELTMEMKQKYIGKSIRYMIDDLRKMHEINATYEELYEKKNRYYMEIAKDNTSMFPQMKIVFDEIRKLGIPMAVASGTDKEVINFLFRNLDIDRFFSVIISAIEVPRGKPDPAIYIETAERLGISAENILVFEDSFHGVESAVRAGMKTVAIPYPVSEKYNDWYYRSDLLFGKGMTEVSWESIEKKFFSPGLSEEL